MKPCINWEFPLQSVHSGMMLGNATTGLLVWGESDTLKITIGRADFWDHRGGMPWTEKQNFKDIRKCLEANDSAGIKAIFACKTESVPGQPPRPSVVPVGRIDLSLGKGAELKSGKINIKSGEASVVYNQGGSEKTIKIQLAMESQTALIELPDKDIKVKDVPSWEHKGEYLKSISFEPPLALKDKTLGGWIQKLPADPALCVGHRADDGRLWIITERGDDIDALKKSAAQKLADAISAGPAKLSSANRAWWKNYWKDIPEVSVPNDKIDFIYRYGLYKFAGFTNPSGVPATLQGPWIEDHEMPPWSSDYHFNINVQMCYWPAYKANRTGHLKPIFDLVWSWRDQLRRNAKHFVGVDDGYMLPHAVDDRCVCMGSFWTGTVDHACTAWIAQMMFSYYSYTGDLEFLKSVAYPFMKGAMRVYEAMMEEKDGVLTLPLSVSPEYGGAAMDAWGANASFQLAAAHRLCADLINASAILGEKPDPAWGKIGKHLPKVSLFGEKGKERIGLWNGKDLERSHRHHSHLGAICPFETIDIYSEEWARTVSNSIDHWIWKGMGEWSGWCVPWASMIHSRLGNGDAAEIMLELLLRNFTNKGHGSLHDCDISGFSIMGHPPFAGIPGRSEIMQMDAGMGAVTAVQDMLTHTRGDVVHIFPGVPAGWKDVSFKDMPCGGGFLVSAVRENGKTVSVTVKSLRGGSLKIADPWALRVTKYSHPGVKRPVRAKVTEITLKKGETRTLTKGS
jgi:hypothetical protein